MTGETVVADEQIASAAEGKEGDAALAGKADGGQDLKFVGGFEEPARGATYSESGVRGERNILKNCHLA